MTEYIALNGLFVAKSLHDLVVNEIAPGTAINDADFWAAVAALVEALGPMNEQLLAKRAALQHQLGIWHGAHLDAPTDLAEYKDFLRDIGYLAAAPITMNTKAVLDAQGAQIAEGFLDAMLCALAAKPTCSATANTKTAAPVASTS